jgi:hypothetical protein
VSARILLTSVREENVPNRHKSSRVLVVDDRTDVGDRGDASDIVDVLATILGHEYKGRAIRRARARRA